MNECLVKKMLKARGKNKVRDLPLLFTNPFYSTGPKTKLKNTVNALPTGVYSVEARDLALDKKRDRERLRTGALSAKQLRLKAVKKVQMKRKWLDAIKKLVQSKGLSDELAQNIHALTNTSNQWNTNAARVDELERRMRQEIDAAMPLATVNQKNAALSLYKAAVDMANENATEAANDPLARRRRGLFGRGMEKLLRVPRIFEITKPDANRFSIPSEIAMGLDREREKWKEGQQESFRENFIAKHGVAPKHDIVKEAFPNTAEPLVAVSIPKPNPTMASNRLKTVAPFVYSHW